MTMELNDSTAPQSMLRRALSIIDALDVNQDECVTLTELSRRTELPKATAHRLIAELVQWGALERHGRCYTLGTRLFVLGENVRVHTQLRDVSIPYVSALFEEIRESVNIGVLHETHLLFVAQVAGHHSAKMRVRIGDLLPSHTTATGKVLLAYSRPGVVRRVLSGKLERRTPYTIVMPGALATQLHAIAERGYATNSEEMFVGADGIAAPIFGADGSAVAAISVVGPHGRITPERMLVPLKRTARELSQILRSTPLTPTEAVT